MPATSVYVTRRHGGTGPEPIALEADGWIALSSGGEDARTFNEAVLDETVVKLLPGGIVLEDRAATVDAMSGSPWSSYPLEDMRLCGAQTVGS